jgi:hypothetical protein
MLREFVRVYAQREVQPFASGAPTMVQPIPSRLEQILEFQLGIPYTILHRDGRKFATPSQAIVGAQVEGCSQIELRPGVLSFGVFFRPCGLSRLLRLPVRECTSRDFDAALTSKMFPRIWERLADLPTFKERIAVIEDTLLMLAMRTQRMEMMVAAAEHTFFPPRCNASF